MLTLTSGVSGLQGKLSTLPALPRRQRTRTIKHSSLVCQSRSKNDIATRVASPEHRADATNVLAVPMAAAALAGLLLSSAVMMPEEAFAARSSGRVGGSSFRSSAPSGGGAGGGNTYRGGNTYNSYTVAPSIGGYGGGGYYGGGFGGGITLFPRFYSPPVFGVALPLGIMFNLIFTLFVVGAAFAVVKSIFSAVTRGGSGGSKKDEWD